MLSSSFPLSRAEIAEKVRRLRKERGLTQQEVASTLDLSQNRYSEIERGQGSFSAEQFLAILRLFNVPVSHFAEGPAGSPDALQNALARHGATHLNEDPNLVPSERLARVEDAIRETLVDAGSSRQITALATVLSGHIEQVNLTKVWSEFVKLGLERRFAWLLEGTRDALREELKGSLPRRQAQGYRKAEWAISEFLERVAARTLLAEAPLLPDPLSATILSKKTREELVKGASEVSRKWAILTSIQPEDFVQALRASHVAD